MDLAMTIGCLGTVDDETRQRLSDILWGWKLCGQCISRPSCSKEMCPWNRCRRLDSFWSLYEMLTGAYSLECLGRPSALRTHSDLLGVINKIRAVRTIPRRQLLCDIFEASQPDGAKPPTLNDQNRAFNIGASVLLLMDFGILHDDANVATASMSHNQWRDDMSAVGFIDEAFPLGPMESSMQRIPEELKARKLIKSARLQLVATNDIRRHLALDKKNRTVWIFHHSTALRELLIMSESNSSAAILPRSLVLEVLDTLYGVLFPLEPNSQKLLRSFVQERGWDKGLLSDMSTPYRRKTDPEVTYAYFGDRLRELHEELLSPTPHGWLERRLQRKNETYMLKATMYGVFIAVTLGFLSLGVAIFQAWVGYQQWKHPMREP